MLSDFPAQTSVKKAVSRMLENGQNLRKWQSRIFNNYLKLTVKIYEFFNGNVFF